jgi:hypothetical protein
MRGAVPPRPGPGDTPTAVCRVSGVPAVWSGAPPGSSYRRSATHPRGMRCHVTLRDRTFATLTASARRRRESRGSDTRRWPAAGAGPSYRRRPAQAGRPGAGRRRGRGRADARRGPRPAGYGARLRDGGQRQQRRGRGATHPPGPARPADLRRRHRRGERDRAVPAGAAGPPGHVRGHPDRPRRAAAGAVGAGRRGARLPAQGLRARGPGGVPARGRGRDARAGPSARPVPAQRRASGR